MPHYDVFGGTLVCDVDIPELRAARRTPPSWVLRTVTAPPDVGPLELVGEAELMPGSRVRLFRHPSGYRLDYDDTGIYDVLGEGRDIRWCPGSQPRPGWVRTDITGRVLSVALYAAGKLCLHGSAVALPAGTVAFIAPKYHGKSTLALALARAGGRLVTDDILPVDTGPPARALPGVHQVRLWDDSAQHFGVADDARDPGDKHLFHAFGEERLMRETTPLAAVYLLAPVPGDTANGPVRREPLDDVTAALALVRQGALGTLLVGPEAPTVFDRAATLAAQVPTYRLEVARGLAQLHQVTDELLRWHSRAAAPTPTRQGAGA